MNESKLPAKPAFAKAIQRRINSLFRSMSASGIGSARVRFTNGTALRAPENVARKLIVPGRPPVQADQQWDAPQHEAERIRVFAAQIHELLKRPARPEAMLEERHLLSQRRCMAVIAEKAVVHGS